MSTINTADFVTTSEASLFLGVSAIRVRQFCQTGKLRPVKVAGRWLISKRALDKFSKIERRPGNPNRKS